MCNKKYFYKSRCCHSLVITPIMEDRFWGGNLTRCSCNLFLYKIYDRDDSNADDGSASILYWKVLSNFQRTWLWKDAVVVVLSWPWKSSIRYDCSKFISWPLSLTYINSHRQNSSTIQFYFVVNYSNSTIDYSNCSTR